MPRGIRDKTKKSVYYKKIGKRKRKLVRELKKEIADPGLRINQPIDPMWLIKFYPDMKEDKKIIIEEVEILENTAVFRKEVDGKFYITEVVPIRENVIVCKNIKEIQFVMNKILKK